MFITVAWAFNGTLKCFRENGEHFNTTDLLFRSMVISLLPNYKAWFNLLHT